MSYPSQTVYSVCVDMPALRSLEGIEEGGELRGLINAWGGVARRYNADRTQSIAALNRQALTVPELEALESLPYVSLHYPEEMYGYRVHATDEDGNLLFAEEETIVGYSNVKQYKTVTDELTGEEIHVSDGYAKEPVYGHAPIWTEIAATDTDGRTLYESIYDYVTLEQPPLFGLQGSADHILEAT